MSSTLIDSPPVNVYSESHQWQRRLQPVSRTNAHGRPACDDSPWMEWKISVTRIMFLQFMLSAAKHLRQRRNAENSLKDHRIRRLSRCRTGDPSLRSG